MNISRTLIVRHGGQPALTGTNAFSQAGDRGNKD
jgi:hypothetical protein